MGVDHLGGDGLAQQFAKIWAAIRDISKATFQNASIGRGGLRVYGGGWIRIEDGGLAITGTQTVSGRLEGNGVLDWEGTVYFRGPTGVQGNFAVSGATTLSGAVTLNNNLTLGTGRITAGPITIDRNGSYGGRIYSSGTLLLDAATSVVSGSSFQAIGSISAIGNVTATGNIFAVGDIGGGSKSFWIDHPTKPGKHLRHGSLEGPEHGVYYRGSVTFDEDGEATFALPDYFTPLVLSDDEPTVQVTPIGRPFLAGAERVAEGAVTIYGDPGREAHVTVTAARERFDIEPDKVEPEPVAWPWPPPAHDEDEE
ncbi:hypothetical protein [Microbacterium saperdae]|uniref:Uncharacterized protein n=1 Tax=Microbacterium saperdae TaxID=69368 RepID=A0A543BQV1_9MICO|nr:hypothetical protein [Microbacterium saperdae]TQL87203.1 hypothetical protein FB560_2870 [Microbacterium saperdae]